MISRDGKAQQLNLIPSHLETTPQAHSPPVFLVFEPGTKERTDDSDCKGSGFPSACADWKEGGVGRRVEDGERSGVTLGLSSRASVGSGEEGSGSLGGLHLQF